MSTELDDNEYFVRRMMSVPVNSELRTTIPMAFRIIEEYRQREIQQRRQSAMDNWISRKGQHKAF